MATAHKVIQFNRDGRPLAPRVLDVLAQFNEGLLAAETKELFPGEGNPNAVPAALSLLKAAGAVKVIGKRVSPLSGKLCSVFAATGKPLAEPVRSSPTRKAPTSIGMVARLDAANAKVAELEEWKADAIKRFPDLAVDPAVIQARKRVAAMFRSDGDSMKADAALSGQMDNTPIMRAVTATIEDLAA